MLNQDKCEALPRMILTVWFLSAIVIPVLSAFGRPLQHWVYRNFGETAVAVMIGICLLALGSAAIYRQMNRIVKWHSYSHLFIGMSLLIVVAIITISLPQTEERLHFVTFGIFGFFSRRLFSVWIALLAIVTWSVGDELFQAWLPDRVGDWRDVGINIVAGVIGLGFAWAGPKKEPSRLI